METIPALASIRTFAKHGGQPLQDKAPRFTRDGDIELESHLARTCDRVRNGIQRIIPSRKLEAIMLGGGYGRGEGGVLKTESGDRPYNDLEFYVCVRGNRLLNDWRYVHALQRLAEKLSPSAGVELEFKIISLDYLRRSPVTMFFYDLVEGHRWLWGDEELLCGCEHHRVAANIPLSEATRLLMNRCSGLLFAREKLKKPLALEDADFVRRNLAKAKLAFGDTILASLGQYNWSCLERQARLHHLTPPLPWLPEVCSHHVAGVEFKLHPRRTPVPMVALQSEFEELAALGRSLWLWLEGRRLACSFESVREYVMRPIDKCPETNPWRNYLVNVRTFGPAALFAKRSARCPQERLLNALALLLWEPWCSDLQLTHRLQSELRLRSTRQDVPTAYHSLWTRLN